MKSLSYRNRGRLLRVLGVLGLAVVALVFWRPLVGWFTGRPMRGGAGATGGSAADSQGPPSQGFRFDDGSLEYLRAAFQGYDSVRALLAKDTTTGLAARAQEIASSLRAAADSARDAPEEVSTRLKEGAQIAAQLQAARALAAAREQFANLSRSLVSLAAADSRLQEGWHAFECPMQKGFNRWFQRKAQRENPYMGQKMVGCGSTSSWSLASADKGAHAPGEISHYTCSMHPSVKQKGPGTCPICSMDLVPVTREEVQEGVLFVDEGRRQRIGVKIAPVTVAPMDLDIRALGRVTYDEKALVDVTLKLDGYIHDLKVNATGEPLKKGQVLFTLYSPELYAAQQEYLLAQNSHSEANASLLSAAKKRLELWGLQSWQIEEVAKRGEPIENMAFLSPASGFVLEKNVVEGAAVKAGERLFRIVPLQKVWVEADVYEHDLPEVKLGHRVEITMPYMPGRKYQGRVSYIYPTLDGRTRTGKVRIELPNEGLELKPDMYANVEFKLARGERLQVPESAVIYTGPRTLVFLDLGEGRLKPQEVKLGAQGDGSFEVLSGLEEGDRVVTSGNFLIAAESRIRSAADYWGGGEP